MYSCVFWLGLSFAAFSGVANAFVPASSLGPTVAARSTDGFFEVASRGRHVTGVSKLLRSQDRLRSAAFVTSGRSPLAAVRNDPTRTATVATTSLRAKKEDGVSGSEKKMARTTSVSSISALTGVGGFGSNLLLGVVLFMVFKGLFMPEDIRHLSFCPSEDPIRGRDTLPWRMMIESGRECGSIPEVLYKYVTAPLVLPGSPEWGVMLNVQEDLAKEGW